MKIYTPAFSSSMLTVPLGAALTADSVFSDPSQDELTAIAAAGVDNPNFQVKELYCVSKKSCSSLYSNSLYNNIWTGILDLQ